MADYDRVKAFCIMYCKIYIDKNFKQSSNSKEIIYLSHWVLRSRSKCGLPKPQIKNWQQSTQKTALRCIEQLRPKIHG
jgi:hypothetical protein